MGGRSAVLPPYCAPMALFPGWGFLRDLAWNVLTERRRRQAVHWAKRFAAAHDGATALLEPLGRPGTRIVLVGASGRWSDLVVIDAETARHVCELAGIDVAPDQARDHRSHMHDGRTEWRRMGHPGGG